MRNWWILVWKKDLSVFLVLLVVSICIMAFGDNIQANPVSSLLARIFIPFQAFAYKLMDLSYVHEENAILRGRLMEVSKDNMALREGVQEVERLRRLVDFKMIYPAPLVSARVVGLIDERLGGGLVIDKGTDSGLGKNMTVVCPDGLVGLITAAGPSASTVKRIIDPGSRVSAMLLWSRSTGILRARSGGRLVMEWVAPDAEIVPADTVISSGLGSVIPKGLFIGEVTKVEEAPEKFSLSLGVKAFADFGRLEEVFVVLRRPAEMPGLLEGAMSGEVVR